MSLRITLHCLLGMALSTLLAACGHQPDAAFHTLAEYAKFPPPEQQKLLLPFDAYVIGLEKTNASRIGRVEECPPGSGAAAPHCLHINAPYYADRPELQASLRKLWDPARQLRPIYVSHIARFDAPYAAPCYLYSAYDASLNCPGASDPGDKAGVATSWSALDKLHADLEQRISRDRPTHVLVYTMGWNTDQRESLDNFRDLVRELKQAAASAQPQRTFKPLVIGVTWPSTGSPTIQATDFGVKASDADEVGAVWLNALLNGHLRQLKRDHAFKLVVVGHSFGARATSRGAFSAGLLGVDEATPAVDLLIGLQGAYSYQRYLAQEDGTSPEGIEGAPYRDFAKGAGTVALTASSFDTAVTAAGHGKYFVGSKMAYDQSSGGPQRNRFLHVRAEANGDVPGLKCGPERVMWIDASEVINTPKPGTGGGAHSGIYTPGVGRLTFRLIQECAPPG